MANGTTPSLQGHLTRDAIIQAQTLNLLVDLERFDEAEALVREGRQRLRPKKALYAVVFARFAHDRGDLEEALTRTAYARYAVRRKDWPEALRRWEPVARERATFRGPVGMVQALREMGRKAEAEELATATCERFPAEPWPVVELAHIAAAEGDQDGICGAWKVTRGRCPYFPLASTAGVEAERKAGREDEADAILTLSVARFWCSLPMHLAYARNADSRGDRDAATERWALVRNRFPDCAEARARGSEAVAPGELRDQT